MLPIGCFDVRLFRGYKLDKKNSADQLKFCLNDLNDESAIIYELKLPYVALVICIFDLLGQ